MDYIEDEVKATQPSSITTTQERQSPTQGNPFNIPQGSPLSLKETAPQPITVDSNPPNQLEHRPITDSPNIALCGKHKSASILNKNPLLKKLSGTFSDAACVTINTIDVGQPIADKPNERRMGTELGGEEPKGLNQSMNTLLTKQSTPIEKKELIEDKKGLFLGTLYETTSKRRFGCNPANTCCNIF